MLSPLGIGPDWQTLGTISIDVHVVEVGEGNRLHEGYSHYYRRDEGSPLSSAKPHCSTEVTSLRKIATFTFKYRPLGTLDCRIFQLRSHSAPSDILQEYGIAPVVAPQTPLRIATTGDKRSAPEYDSDDDEGNMYSPTTPDTPSLSFSSGGSDSDSSLVSCIFFYLASSMSHCNDRIGAPYGRGLADIPSPTTMVHRPSEQR